MQQSFSVQDIQGGFGIGTAEQPPQVELGSDLGSLVVPKGTSSMTLSITPIAVPSAQPPNGIVAGNAYRVSLINQSGAAVKAKVGGSVTLVMRGPTQLPEATIEQYSSGRWTQLQTSPAGIPDTFSAVIPAFGDFALVAPYAWVPTGESTPGPSGTEASQAGARTGAGSVPSSAAESSFPPTGGSAASGQDLVPIVGIAVSFAVLVSCMIALWRLGRGAKPGPDT
jgi:hypothetical protein